MDPAKLPSVPSRLNPASAPSVVRNASAFGRYPCQVTAPSAAAFSSIVRASASTAPTNSTLHTPRSRRPISIIDSIPRDDEILPT